MDFMTTTFKFEAIGTKWVIDIYEDLSADEAGALLLKKIMERIEEFDKNYSRFRDDSLVMKMSRKAGEFELPPDADKMISIYKKMYDVTGGLVTPLIGQVLSDAGYDAKYSLKKGELSKPKSWGEVIEWKNPKLILKESALLDFGAGGKGYLVDIVSEILENKGVDSYCVDAGGDMRHRSSKSESLKVGLEHPTDKESVIGVLPLLNKSLCGSAGNRRVWGDFHHIIDPQKLSSPKEILAVWVLADDTLTADILTTGLFFVPTETLLKHYKFEYLIVKSGYSIEKSEGFDAEIYT